MLLLQQIVFATMPIYKFLDWIDATKLELNCLGQNPSPATMYYFDKHRHKLRWYRGLHKNNIIYDPQIIRMMQDDDWEDMSAMPELIVVLEKNPEKINWEFLCENPAACHLIKKVIEEEGPYSKKLYWSQICCNKSRAAIEILLDHINKIHWVLLSSNPFALDILKQYPEEIDWENLSYVNDDRVIEFLEQNIDKIDWNNLSENIHPRAVALLKKYPTKINWDILNFNTNSDAIRLLESRPDKIKIEYLCSNENPEAILLLERTKNIENIKSFVVWHLLSENSAAIDLLRRNQDKIYWPYFSKNPAIFTYDYARMRDERRALHGDLAAWFWSPERVGAFLNEGGEIDDLDDMFINPPRL